MNHRTRKHIRLPPHAYACKGRIFSATLCSSGRRPIFKDRPLSAVTIDSLAQTRFRLADPVYAYCLMPDHLHLLIGIEETPLPSFIQAFKSEAYRHWRKGGSQPSFWQRGYYERALRRKDEVRAAAIYILNNPVRAGLVEHWTDYPLSGSFEWGLDDF